MYIYIHTVTVIGEKGKMERFHGKTRKVQMRPPRNEKVEKCGQTKIRKVEKPRLARKDEKREK